MTLEQQTLNYLAQLANVASEAQSHFDEYVKELAATDIEKATKMVSMSLVCREITRISQQV